MKPNHGIPADSAKVIRAKAEFNEGLYENLAKERDAARRQLHLVREAVRKPSGVIANEWYYDAVTAVQRIVGR